MKTLLLYSRELTNVKSSIKNVYVAIMGETGAGKSKFVNLCCGNDVAVVGKGWNSCKEAYTYGNDIYSANY
jgi:ABC-type thiamine transport system ATPase subunit